MSNKDRITYLEDRLRFLTRELCELKAFQQKMWEAANPAHEVVPSDISQARLDQLNADIAFNRTLDPACVTAAKPIDWSQVADCVPVKVWDDNNVGEMLVYPSQSSHDWGGFDFWDRASLVTGIDIAWHGGECPLPEGVMIEATRRDGNKYSNREASSFKWAYGGVNSCFDIISFRITSIADGWTEEVGE